MSDLSRRRFIHGIGLGVAGSLLAGCGASDGSDGGVSSGSAAPGASSSSSSSSTAGVNLNQIGGSPLRILNGRQEATVDASGNVSVVTPDTAAQLLFAIDANRGIIRGLTLKIPGQPLTLDASSTALALAYLVPGIATINPALAAQRATLLRNAPSFPALVQSLASLLPTNTVTSILPQIQSLLDAVITDVVGTINPKVTAKVFTAAQAAQRKPGGLYVTAGELLSDNNPGTASFALNNESFRYVSVVRQFFTVRGTAAQVERTNLIGAPIPSAVSVVGAVNGYSIGNLLTGQVLTASTARDDFSLLNNNPPIENVTYYFRGLGYAGHPDNVTLPDDVSANLFQDTADVATLLLSVLFPLVELVVPVGEFKRFSQQDQLEMVGEAAALASSTNTVQAANTGQASNVASAFVDAFISALFTRDFADALIRVATVAGGAGAELVASAALVLLEVLALSLSAANFLATARDIVSRPRIAAIEVPVPIFPFSDEIAAAPDFNAFMDVSADGTVAYQSITGDVFLKKPFRAPQLLGGTINSASLSDENKLTTYRNQSGTIFLRNDDGVTGTIPVPAGMTSSAFSPSGPQIDARGTAVAGQGTLTSNGLPDIFLFERTRADSIGLGSQRVRAQGLFLGGLTENTVFARGGIGSTSTQLARYNRSSGQWSVRTLSAAPFGNLRPDYRGVNRIDEALLFEYKDDDDGFNPVSSTESILVETNAGVEQVYTGGLAAGVGGIRPDPVGINDEGEILAVLYTNDAGFQRTSEETVLFKRRFGSSQVSLASLLPRGMPAGSYRGLGLGGKYAVVTRLQNGSPSTAYLVHLGRTTDDVKRLLGVVT